MSPDKSKKQIKIVLMLLIFFAILVTAWLLYYASTFHLINTDPSAGEINTITPYITFNFSKALAKTKYQITIQPSETYSETVNQKSLTINLSSTLKSNQKYTIIIPVVSDTSGQQIKNLSLVFTPTQVPYTKIPANQQKAILKRQALGTAKNQKPVFIGTSALINSGLSSEQIILLEQALSQYQEKAKVFKINESSVEPGPRNPNTSTQFSLNFSLSIENTPYNATLNYTSITNINLILYNPTTDAQVYDSGVLNYQPSN